MCETVDFMEKAQISTEAHRQAVPSRGGGVFGAKNISSLRISVR